jgi:glutamate-5-semialdehyde dehydrogenase
MNAPLKALEGSRGRPSGAKGASDLPSLMRQIGRDARTAARILALAPAAQKNRALAAMA